MVGPLDCIVVGYNDPPFARYEQLLRNYGVDSEAYRDLRYSFVELDGRALNYVDLLNLVDATARGADPRERRFESGEIPNLAAVYLTNYLQRRGLGARYINLFQQEKEQFRAWLQEKPLCVAITTTFYILNFPANEMIEFIRGISPETKIVVGGPLVGNHLRAAQEGGQPYADALGLITSDRLRTSLDDLGADAYVIDSQGEQTLVDIVRQLRAGGDLSKVPNLIVPSKGRYRRTPISPEKNPMDEVDIRWTELGGGMLGPTLQTRTARSCAFSCAFCSYPERAGDLALASVDTVERELDAMHALGTRQVVFIDDTFNVPLARFKDLCRLLIRKRYGFKWFSYFRCSNSDTEAFDLMKEAGCAGVFLGIESGSPAILKNMHKAARIDQYVTGVAALKARGILTFGSFIIGFPGETADTVRETRDFIQSAGLDYYRTQSWYYEHGTPIAREHEHYGMEGDGFVWRHATMDSLEAQDHIDRLFFEITGATWLPQWSFDFWFIPYALGKGLSLEQFGAYVRGANRLLSLDLASVPDAQRALGKGDAFRDLVDAAHAWDAAVLSA
jgi:radical SAM PhpK family P-methyltransferase